MNTENQSNQSSKSKDKTAKTNRTSSTTAGCAVCDIIQCCREAFSSYQQQTSILWTYAVHLPEYIKNTVVCHEKIMGQIKNTATF